MYLSLILVELNVVLPILICDILGVTEGEILNGTSSNSPTYMTKEFNDLLKSCPTEKVTLIYNIAALIINDNI